MARANRLPTRRPDRASGRRDGPERFKTSDLDPIAVRDDAAHHIRGRSGTIGQHFGNQSAGAGFRQRQGLAPAFEQNPRHVLDRILVLADRKRPQFLDETQRPAYDTRRS